jgi:hypothetical protein
MNEAIRFVFGLACFAVLAGPDPFVRVRRLPLGWKTAGMLLAVGFAPYSARAEYVKNRVAERTPPAAPLDSLSCLYVHG